MKKIFAIVLLFCLVVSATNCSEDEKNESLNTATEQEKEDILDNSSYYNVLNNHYNAYAYGDADYEMTTFAPIYKAFVMKQYGYEDEDAMKKQLQSIIDSSNEERRLIYGENFRTVYDIVSAREFSEDEIDSLKLELMGFYGGEFLITDAIEISVKVLAGVDGQTAGTWDENLIVGKLEDGNWYILK